MSNRCISALLVLGELADGQISMKFLIACAKHILGGGVKFPSGRAENFCSKQAEMVDQRWLLECKLACSSGVNRVSRVVVSMIRQLNCKSVAVEETS